MIAVVGSTNLDIVARVDRHPIGGETLMAKSHETAHGGKGANQAVSAARLGAPVAFVGRVGQDAAGDELVAGLANEGIDVSLLSRDQLPTGTALIVLDDKGDLDATNDEVIFTPDAGYDGPASFDYTATDTGDGPDPAITTAARETSS